MSQGKTPNLQVAEFASLFQGNIHNYGQHIYEFAEGEKEKGQNFAVKDKLLTPKEYREHLDGEKGLGVVPTTGDNKCHFSVIDVDLYDYDLSLYIDAIEKNDFPLVPFRSKSGGLHLYCFFKIAISAADAIKLMQKFAALLAIDNLIKRQANRIVEIFPKQSRIKSGTVGSWINLPYFNAEDTEQYAWKDGKALSLGDAIVYINEQRGTKKDLIQFFREMVLTDAPPCLQNLYLLNPLDDTGRNDYLFSFGVYLKKKDETSFEQNLHEINQVLRQPLDSHELDQTMITSIKKKDYTYKCTVSPCADFCNKPVCKTREYGIGKEGGYFSELEYGEMRQIKSSAPYYEWEVKQPEQEHFSRLIFKDEAELIKQSRFLALCMRELHYVPNPLKRSEWIKILNQGLTDVVMVSTEDEFEITPFAVLKAHLHEFIFSRVLAQTKHQIRDGRVYYDKNADGYYFQKEPFVNFLLERKRFNLLDLTEIQIGMKDLGLEQTRIKDEGRRQFRVYFMPQVIAKTLTGIVEVEDTGDTDVEPEEEPEIDFTEYEEKDY